MPLFGSIPANQNVEVDPVWVQPGAPSAPDSGELWWDTDDTSAGITTPLGVTDGGTGATSPATARTSLGVTALGNSTTTAGAPTTGTWARGDQWLDSANVVWTCITAGTPGFWKAMSSITTSVFVTPGVNVATSGLTSYDYSINLPRAGSLLIQGQIRHYMLATSTAYNYLNAAFATAPGGPTITSGYDMIFATGPYPSGAQAGGMLPVIGYYASVAAGTNALRLNFATGNTSYGYNIYTYAYKATLI